MDKEVEQRLKDIETQLVLLAHANLEKERRIKSIVFNFDDWIKQIRREVLALDKIPQIVKEHADNIQHNYELNYEHKDMIDELKQEIDALKLIQIVSLKNNAEKCKKPAK